jgi:RND family efflux transporter MFP subunit
MKSKPLALIALAVLIIAILLALLLRGHGPAPAKTAMQRPALTVTAQAPEAAELMDTLDANGNIAAWQEASIGSESNGLRLAEVRVNVGDTVKKGQVLATFSAQSVLADVAQARAALAEAEAAAADATGNAARARTLEATGALSQQQINQYQTAEQTARARVQAAKAALAAQAVHQHNTQVLAPDNGVISSRTATVGAVAGAGTELFRLIRGGRLEWRAEVTASELSRIRPGTPAVVTSASGAKVRGTVRSVAPTVDAQTRNALVYVDLPGTVSNASALKANMFARGQFELGRDSAWTVPQIAVIPRDGFNHVLVLQPDSHVAMVKVRTGRRVGDRIEIQGALPAGARVIVQGAGFLNDGDLVRVVDASPSASK